MAQKGDSQHPWESHSEALEELNSEGENRSTAEGSDGGSDPVTGGSPPSDGTGGDRDDDPENPLLESPGWRESTAPSCPECGDDMERVGEGMAFSGLTEHAGGKRRVTGRTEPSDMMCDGCSIIRDNSGKIVTNVS